MAVGDADRPRRRWLDALFGEARELQRRRRRYLLVALVCCAAAAAGGLVSRGGSGSSSAPGVHGRLTVTSTTLPAGGDYWSLAAVGGRVIVTGGAQGESLVRGRVTGTCSSESIDPVSLRLLSTVRGNCGDPTLYGRRVLPITYVVSHSGSTGLMLGLRIATVAAGARDGYRLGPTLLTYSQCSDCGIASIYGDGSLWVYSPFRARMGDRVGELFRISERTGRVVQRWPMPSFTRALLAVDEDGLWMSQSLYGGVPLDVPRAQRIEYRSLYRIAPGMRSPVRVRQLDNWGAYWIVASGHSVWVDESEGRKPSRLWRLEGGQAAPAINARFLPSGAECAETGEGQSSTVGDAQIGVYCIALSQTGGHLQGFDADTGLARATPVSALQKDAVSMYDSGAGPAVVLRRSVFFLEKSRLFRAATT